MRFITVAFCSWRAYWFKTALLSASSAVDARDLKKDAADTDEKSDGVDARVLPGDKGGELGTLKLSSAMESTSNALVPNSITHATMGVSTRQAQKKMSQT
jgi:hypothetical protein